MNPGIVKVNVWIWLVICDEVTRSEFSEVNDNINIGILMLVI